MQFDKLIFRRANRSGRHIRVTVDFGIGEITAQSAPGGEVMWCRLAGYRGTVLRMKLDACDFGTMEGNRSERDRNAFTDGRPVAGPISPAGWSLDLCREGEPVKHLSGDDDTTEQGNAFASLIDLCLSFVEERSAGQRRVMPSPAF